MDTAVKAARIGNKVLSFIAFILIMLMLLYGGYSLWYNYTSIQGAFLGNDILKYKPAADSTGENYSLEELIAINPDTRGWLTIDNTHIDYPVVQGPDDMQYVNMDIFGEFSLSGAIFLSCLNSSDFSDPYNLVYGHHMDNGGMFGDVMEFIDSGYFEKHQTGTLNLPKENYHISLFALVETDAYDSYIYAPNNITDTTEFLKYIKNKATNYRDIGVTSEDRIIAFSTCVDAVTNGRAVLLGRLENK